MTLVKKPEPQPVLDEANRFDQIRKAAREGHRRSEIRRNAPTPDKTAKANRLI